MIRKIEQKLLLLRNRLTAFCFDITMTACAWLMAYWLRYDLHVIPLPLLHEALIQLPVVLIIQSFLFWIYGLYRGVWHFASIPDLTRIIKSVISGIIVLLIIFFFVKSWVELPRAVPLLYGVLLTGALAGARVAYRWLKDYRKIFHDAQRVLVVGGGAAGEGLIRDLMRHAKHLYYPVAIVDDNPVKLYREIHGVPVIGSCDVIPQYVQSNAVDMIMIAMPSGNATQMRRIVNLCEEAGVPYRTLPGVADLVDGKVNIRHLREVALEDLLGRDPVNLDWRSLSSAFEGRRVLILGGGGSIGSEVCRQLAQLGLNRMIIVDHHEYNLYAIEMELRKKFPNLQLVCLLQNITDKIGLTEIFETHLPQVVFHAAAYKHVPLLESQHRAAILNNVIGTRFAAELADEYNAQKFILISTDKAVHPTNIMGASKRAAEIFCQNFNNRSQTEFITVRFGNVLDSAGSVVPLFRKQLQEGGPLTVTHPEITRFFMTIPEASQLIIQAAFMGKGGEIFVLDMGKPIKIRYLAEQVIRLAGKVPNEDVAIIYTGLRPGEKLYEELFYEQEVLCSTGHPKILLAQAQTVSWHEWSCLLDRLEDLCQCKEEENLQLLLGSLVPEYQASGVTKGNIVPLDIVSLINK